MLRNYIKIAIRSLLRSKTFSFITLSGLTLGFTCFLLIFLYVNDELNFDGFHKDADKIYRVVQVVQEENGERKTAIIPPSIGSGALENFEEVEAYSWIFEMGRITVGNEVAKRDYEQVTVVDSNFFSFFDYGLLSGDGKKSLTTPKGVVISEALSRKYFGDTPPLGSGLYTNRFESQISGVMKDFPSNSHLDIHFFITENIVAEAFSWWKEFTNNNWSRNGFIAYLKIEPGTDIGELERKITQLAKSNNKEEDQKNISYELQSLKDIHFQSTDIQGGHNARASKLYYVYLFLSVAVLILLIASFNYMNLSTAAAIQRTREVGLRKTVGASKGQLMTQFLSEAFLLSFCALLFSVLFVDLLLPYLNDFTERQIQLNLLSLPLWGGLILLALLVGFLSGLYPAFVVAKVSPSQAMKSVATAGSKGMSLRKVLVVCQFAIAILMISGTIVIYQQMNYIQNKELGFDQNNLVVIDINSGNLRYNFEAIKAEMNGLPEVQSVSVSSRVPGEWKNFPIVEVHQPGTEQYGNMIFVAVDKDFLSTYEVELLEGENYTSAPSDSLKVMLNKTAVDMLNLENPIGQTIEIPQINWGGNIVKLETTYRATVIGVVEDFYFESFREKLKPMVLAYNNNILHQIDYFTVRLNSENIDLSLKKLAEINNKFDPENPMEYHFLDQQFGRFYKDDARRSTLFLIFSTVIIFISCMGLFALASYSIKQRVKEIGVRKVLGAQLSQITSLLIKDFVLLIAIAFVIATPLAYWLVDQWLSNFAYKIEIPWWAFPAAGLLAMALAISTISYLTIKAASANPVDTLRSE